MPAKDYRGVRLCRFFMFYGGFVNKADFTWRDERKWLDIFFITY